MTLQEMKMKSSFVYFLKIILMTTSVFTIISFVIAAVLRMNYPYEIEWMEGGMLYHVQRIIEGLPLYVKPSLSFIPYFYTPLYYYICAFFSLLFGNTLFSARLVSMLATIGNFALIFRYVFKNTDSRFAGVVAVGMFAATFRISGYWFDLARADSVNLLLMLSAVSAFSSEKPSIRNVFTPLFLILAFLTKQSVVILMAGIMLSSFLKYRGFNRYGITLIAGAVMVFFAWRLNWQSSGWFRYYAFQLSINRPYNEFSSIVFWTLYLVCAIGVSLIPFLVPLKKITYQVLSRIPWEVLSLILMSYLLRIHACAINALIPSYAAVAIAVGLCIPFILQMTFSRWWLKFSSVFLILFVFAQDCVFTIRSIPSVDSRKQGDKLLAMLAKIPGPVYFPSHPWYLSMVHKEMHVQEMAAADFLHAANSAQNQQELREEFQKKIESEYYEAVITDVGVVQANKELMVLRPKSFSDHYQLVSSNVCDSSFFTTTGAIVKPTYLYLRKNKIQHS